MSEIEVVRNGSINSAQIMDLMFGNGLAPGTSRVWDDCLERSPCVVTAREPDTTALVGIGIVAGNLRHAELTDLNVRKDYRRQGIGKRIGQEMLSFVLEEGIPYVSLTFDASEPWLEKWYEKSGFVKIGFAMWHESSLKKLREPGKLWHDYGA